MATKLGAFLTKLKSGKNFSQDPFSEDFFDVREHLRRKEAEVPAIIEEAFARAKEKAAAAGTSPETATQIWREGQKVKI